MHISMYKRKSLNAAHPSATYSAEYTRDYSKISLLSPYVLPMIYNTRQRAGLYKLRYSHLSVFT